MTPPASPYDRSDAALKSLQRTLQKHDIRPPRITLPERPRCAPTDQNRYLDSAVSVLSISTESICNDSSHWAITAIEVKESVNKVEQRIDDLDCSFHLFYEDVDERFTRLEQRVQKLESKIEEIRIWAEGRFKGLEGRFTNMGASEPWDSIVPVEYPHDKSDRNEFLEIHPDRIIKLWHLKGPRQRQNLLSLIKYYNIDGWESWGYEEQWMLNIDPDSSDEERDSIDSEERNPDLPTAVRNHPEIALRALTVRLGINYNRMKNTMESYKLLKQRRAEKRKQQTTSEGSKHHTAKRVVTSELPREPRLPIEDLVDGNSPHNSKSSRSGTKLGWGSHKEPPRALRDAKSVSSGDTTIPFSNKT